MNPCQDQQMTKSSISVDLELKIETAVNPSESPEKVISAITNIFGGCSPELRYGSLIVASCFALGCLRTIYDQIRSRSAMGVLRRMLTNNRSSNTTWFLLNKQAAAAGTVVVIEEESESPLGPIRVRIMSDGLDELIEWLAPLE
jgi:predicted RNA binding protein with dsRBD fold (UPF0201 family)